MRSPHPRSALALLLCALLLAAPAVARESGTQCEEAGSEACERRPLEPSYEPRTPSEPEVYTTKYYFATTRAVANSTIVPAGRVPLFLLTIPIDIAFLPVAALAGFFPGD